MDGDFEDDLEDELDLEGEGTEDEELDTDTEGEAGAMGEGEGEGEEEAGYEIDGIPFEVRPASRRVWGDEGTGLGRLGLGAVWVLAGLSPGWMVAEAASPSVTAQQRVPPPVAAPAQVEEISLRELNRRAEIRPLGRPALITSMPEPVPEPAQELVLPGAWRQLGGGGVGVARGGAALATDSGGWLVRCLTSG